MHGDSQGAADSHEDQLLGLNGRFLPTHAVDGTGQDHGEDDADILRDRGGGGEGEPAMSIHHRFAGAHNSVEHQLWHAEQEQQVASSTLAGRLLRIRDPNGEQLKDEWSG